MKKEAERLNKIIQNYATDKPEALEEASNILGIDVGLWQIWTDGEITQEDLDSAQELVRILQDTYPESSSQEVHTSSSTQSMGSLLKECKNLDIDPFESTLPQNIFNELAALTAQYSSHRKTKTVHFKGNKLSTHPKDAFQDGSKDTFNDNGEVATSYYNLIRAIINHASNLDPDSPLFNILGRLYCFLTTLSPDACNQQNALEFAEVLQQFSPEHNDTTNNSNNSNSSYSLLNDFDSFSLPTPQGLEDALLYSDDGTLWFIGSLSTISNMVS